MSSLLNFKITTAGYSAAINANTNGLQLTLTHVQFGVGHKTPDGSEVNLISLIDSQLLVNALQVGDRQIRFSAVFSGSSSYDVSEIGIWAGDPQAGGILFAYHSVATGILASKSANVDLIFSHEMVLDNSVPANSITVAISNTSISIHEGLSDPHGQYLKEADAVTQANAEAGIETTVRAWSALRVKQAIVKLITGHVALSDPHTQYAKKSEKSSSVTSTSTVTIANSSAAKTAYDKGVEALNTANGKLGASAKAVDSDKLDGLDSAQFIRSDAGDTAHGNHAFYSDDITGNFDSGSIELNEVGLVASAQSSKNYAPALSLHWRGVSQAQIALESDSVVRIRDGIAPHTSLSPLDVSDIRVNGNSLIPSGTKMLFIQSAAPAGWTRDTSDAANNRMLRILSSGNAGGVGGSGDPISFAHSHSTGSHTLSANEMPYHQHKTGWGEYSAGPYGSVPGATHQGSHSTDYDNYEYYTSAVGANWSHNHGNTGSATISPRYINSLLATKD